MRKSGMMPSAVDAALNVAHVREAERAELKRLLLQAVANELADFCKSQNGRFDRERWLGYIAGENGPNGGAVKVIRDVRT